MSSVLPELPAMSASTSGPETSLHMLLDALGAGVPRQSGRHAGLTLQEPRAFEVVRRHGKEATSYRAMTSRATACRAAEASRRTARR